MKRKKPAPTWVVDYSAARAHAIRWLGDRYLLAIPINGGHRSRQPAPGIFLANAADRTDPPQPASNRASDQERR